MLEKLIKYFPMILISSFVALLILLVLPITNSIIADTKLYFLFLASLIVGIIYFSRSIKKNNIEIVVGPLTAPLLILGGSTLISTFFTNDYPVENLLGLGGAMLAMTIIAILGPTIFPEKRGQKVLVFSLAIVSGALLGLSLMQLAGFGPAQWLNNIPGFAIPASLEFNLAGSTLIGFQLAVVALVGVVSYYLTTKKCPKLTLVSVVILLGSLVIYGWTLLPGKSTSINLPSYAASWSVALDSLRSPRAAMIGVGPANYIYAYERFKPLWVNAEENWAINYDQAANVPLTVISTMGLIGLAAWAILAIATLNLRKKITKQYAPLVYMIAVMLLLQILLPANIIMLALLGLTVAILGASEKNRLPILQFKSLSAKMTTQRQIETSTPAYFTEKSVVSLNPFKVVSILLLVGTLFVCYLAGRSYAAEFYSFKASQAIIANDAVKTYELQAKATQLNPYLDRLRRQYATTNALIAIALSNRTDADEQDMQQIADLHQQAIREARAATLLNPNNSLNWLALAQIYEQIVGVSDEALQWAIQGYLSAIETDPTNPNLRIALGGLLLSQESYAQAQSVFRSAIDIKPDFANSYFNFAVASEGLGQLDESKAGYQQVLALLDPDNEDYAMVNERLAAVEKLIEERGDKPSGDKEGSGPEAETKAPSILEQNLQPAQDLTKPATENVELDDKQAPKDVFGQGDASAEQTKPEKADSAGNEGNSGTSGTSDASSTTKPKPTKD